MIRRLLFVFVASGLVLTESASAQGARSILDYFRGTQPAATQPSRPSEWAKIPANELDCIDQELRKEGTSAKALRQRGVAPTDERVAKLRSECRKQLSQAAQPARAQSSSDFVVDGLALGSRAPTEHPSYSAFQCSPSEVFAGLTWCQRVQRERTGARERSTSTSILHHPDGRAAYVNRVSEPVVYGAGGFQNEFDRLSARHGKPARVLRIPDKDGLPDAIIAVWGTIQLDPLDSDSVATLAAGGSPRKGLLADFIGNFQRSARLGLPVYRLSSGAGYIWSASADSNGRGHQRALVFDADLTAPAQVAERPNAATPLPAGDAAMAAENAAEKAAGEIVAAEKVAADKAAAEKAAADKAAADAAATDRAAAEKLAALNVAAEKAAAEKAAAEKLAALNAAALNAAAEKAAAEKAAAEKAAAERTAAEKATETVAALNVAAEKAAAEKAAALRLAAESAAVEKEAALKAAAEKAAADKEAALRVAAEKAAGEKAAALKAAAEKAAAEKTAALKAAAEKAAAEKEAALKVAAEKAAAEKDAALKAAAERAAAEKAGMEKAAEKAAVEKIAAEKDRALKAAAERAAGEKLALAQKAALGESAAERAAAAQKAEQRAAKFRGLFVDMPSDQFAAAIKDLGFDVKLQVSSYRAGASTEHHLLLEVIAKEADKPVMYVDVRNEAPLSEKFAAVYGLKVLDKASDYTIFSGLNPPKLPKFTVRRLVFYPGFFDVTGMSAEDFAQVLLRKYRFVGNKLHDGSKKDQCNQCMIGLLTTGEAVNLRLDSDGQWALEIEPASDDFVKQFRPPKL
ncbi:MAG: hypothetical protein ACXW3X_00950 [Rhodoplanes sp.]